MGQTDRQTDVEPGGQESKQTAIGVVRQAASPGILSQISKLSEERDK